jgi:hypothetical protein
VEDPAEELSTERFFADLLNAVMDNAPVSIHKPVRLKRMGEEPPGGLPPSDGVTPDE